MAFMRLVVERRPLLHRLCQPGRIEGLLRREAKQLFGHVEQIAAIAIGHGAHCSPRRVIKRQALVHGGLGALQQLLHGRVIQAIQHEDLAARQQRAVQFKGGILGRGADQHHGAVLDIGEKPILLRAVEAMDLIDEQQSPLAHPPAVARRLEHLAQIGDAGEHG
jgi:hypothetical protein